MKLHIIAILAFIPFISDAQVDEDKLWENARYQVSTDKHKIYYTDVNNAEGAFTESDLQLLKQAMFQKEGIVRIELIDLDRTFRIFYFEYIEIEIIKDFVLPIEENVEFMEKKPVMFR